MDIWTIAWYCLWAVLVLVAYKLYEFLYLPWVTWRRYLKYPNAWVTDKFYPFVGIIALMKKCIAEGKFRFQFYIDEIIKRPNIDVIITQFGPFLMYELSSVKALNEFEKIVPDKVDRNDDKGLFVQNIVGNSFALMRSKNDWNDRRKAIMKTIGINFASQYISLMIETVDSWAKTVSIGAEIDLTLELNRITF
mmetsp:Transcript_5267/g.6259  ORF Transcript_5267/g.6259 Transcript_5267/m.6259 type:complete len:193 (-) Transcript_5267:109-687(-)